MNSFELLRDGSYFVSICPPRKNTEMHPASDIACPHVPFRTFAPERRRFLIYFKKRKEPSRKLFLAAADPHVGLCGRLISIAYAGMPPKNAGKGGGGASKKAEQKKKEKIIEVGEGKREEGPHQG